MCSIPFLGAFKKGTTDYVYPAIATKSEQYVCPDCSKDLILKKGQKNAHHFAHYKSTNPCTYYDKPSESQIHKDAKLLLKNLLDNKKQLTFIRKCIGTCGNKPEEYEIPVVTDTSKIVTEHRFMHNGPKIADVAYIDSGEIVCIFEICNTHKTDEINRPEPWFEIDALDLINSVNRQENEIIIQCIRENFCGKCIPVKCHRCNTLSETWLMDTCNNKKWCKGCDIEFWNKTYISVPYSDKDKIKRYGGRFDPLYKKWYIDKNSIHIKTVQSKWTVWAP
jgi:hypothetical protein